MMHEMGGIEVSTFFSSTSISIHGVFDNTIIGLDSILICFLGGKMN